MIPDTRQRGCTTMSHSGFSPENRRLREISLLHYLTHWLYSFIEPKIILKLVDLLLSSRLLTSTRPGKWLMFTDFLIGQAEELNLRNDPRAMFIETVKYTAPWSLQLKGGAVDTIDAVVAQLGLSGIGA